LVTPISPTEIKSYLSNELKGHELLLTLDTISTICVRRLDESKLLHLLSIVRLQLYAELKDASKCVVGEAHGFSSYYVSNCKWCSKISWKIMFYFIICSYSKLEDTKNEFVKHWSEKHY
jgi:hypothetical protein